MTCRLCGRRIWDATSRVFGIDPECRKNLTPEQLRAVLKKAAAEASPGYIPAPRPPSAQARQNNAQARRVVETAKITNVATCARHGGIRGACPSCRAEADPMRAAARIIHDIQQERAAARDAAYIAYHATHGEQLVLEVP